MMTRCRYRQRSLFHLPPWVAWDHTRRERARRAALSPVPTLSLPHWRRWQAAPIHELMARSAERGRGHVADVPQVVRDLLRTFALTEDAEACGRLAPAFLAWVRGDDEFAQFCGRGEDKREALELARIAAAVEWPSCAVAPSGTGNRRRRQSKKTGDQEEAGSMKLRKYQSRAANATVQAWRNGSRGALTVAPPGAGKTEIQFEVLRRSGGRMLWMEHQRELAQQIVTRARDAGFSVGAIMGGYNEGVGEQIVVATPQSLLSRQPVSGFDALHFDEAHHYLAESWSAVALRQPGGFARISGATATPERATGEPLGDMFDTMHVAASYSELIAGGFILQPHVVRPQYDVGGNWAMSPLDAWASVGFVKTILYVPTIDLAEHFSEQANARGLRAADITEKTKTADRAEALSSFAREGHDSVRLLTCVGTLLEGIDLPITRCVILARPFRWSGCYLQAVGRPIRTHEKTKNGTDKRPIVYDLVGATLRHQHPTADRIYSLEGRAIRDGVGGVGGGGYVAPNPAVVDVPMVDDFDPMWRPEAAALPEPDWGRWRREKKRREWSRRRVARYGRTVAEATL